MIPFGQGFASMTPAVSKLEEVLLLGEMRHGNNPVMTMCFNNTVVINDPAGNRKFDKAKSTGRIDGSVATAMAIGSAISVKVEKPKQVDPARRSMILV
jgi:phage terminase large subunit-like protein